MVRRKRGETMMNLMEIEGHKAVIKYDPEIEMFRGEFINLNGGADFYADNIQDLKKEGAISLDMFLEACKERGIESQKEYSGKFNVRIPPKLHESVSIEAATEGKSLNKLVVDILSNRFDEAIAKAETMAATVKSGSWAVKNSTKQLRKRKTS
jgi:predicted HicB family RNase H-like nuclease